MRGCELELPTAPETIMISILIFCYEIIVLQFEKIENKQNASQDWKKKKEAEYVTHYYENKL